MSLPLRVLNRFKRQGDDSCLCPPYRESVGLSALYPQTLRGSSGESGGVSATSAPAWTALTPCIHLSLAGRAMCNRGCSVRNPPPLYLTVQGIGGTLLIARRVPGRSITHQGGNALKEIRPWPVFDLEGLTRLRF